MLQQSQAESLEVAPVHFDTGAPYKTQRCYELPPAFPSEFLAQTKLGSHLFVTQAPTDHVEHLAHKRLKGSLLIRRYQCHRNVLFLSNHLFCKYCHGSDSHGALRHSVCWLGILHKQRQHVLAHTSGHGAYRYNDGKLELLVATMTDPCTSQYIQMLQLRLQ